jgi:hypothetical protein
MSDTIQSAWSNDDLLDQLITRANQVSIISESNDIRELRQLVLGRMERTARAEDAETIRSALEYWRVLHSASADPQCSVCSTIDLSLAALSRLSAGKVEP